MSYKAFIAHYDFARDLVRLHLGRFNGPFGPVDVLLADGTWFRAPEGLRRDDDGIELPTEAIEAIAVAITEFQGHTSHADTEARVLREALDIERQRVDRVLATMSLYERIVETQR